MFLWKDVPLNDEIHNLILREAHRVVYMVHIEVKKMNANLKTLFF